MSLSVIIPTLNCEKKIEKCLASVKWADELIVVDMGSTDNTVKIVKQFKAKIYIRIPKNKNFDENRKFGMEKASGDWILKLDSDEELSMSLQNEIRNFLSSPAVAEFSGVYLLNDIYLFGKKVLHGVAQPNSNELRLVKNGDWDYKPYKFHQLITVSGKTMFLKSKYIHYNYETVDEFLVKTNKYTNVDAKFVNKSNIYLKLFFAPLKLFTKLYLFKKGFLDGLLGFEVSFLYSLYNLIEKTKAIELLFLQSGHNQKILKN